MPALEESGEISGEEENEENEELTEDDKFYGLSKDVQEGIKNILSACINPPDEEVRATKDVWRQVMEAERLFPRYKGRKSQKMRERSESTEESDSTPGAELSYMGDTSQMSNDTHNTSGEYYIFFVDDIGVVKIRDLDDLNKAIVDEDEKEDEGLDDEEAEREEVGNDEDAGDNAGAQVFGGPDIIVIEEEEGNDDMEEDETVPPPKADDESFEGVEENSFNFNDSLEIFYAKPMNESQIVTVESSEDSVTMNGSWGSMMDTSTNEESIETVTQKNKFNDEEGAKGN